jgi:hypothetical protein
VPLTCVFKSLVEETMVPERGLEPPLPCENQLLKLARLPIPPLGHKCGQSRVIPFCPPLPRFVNAMEQLLETQCLRGFPGWCRSYFLELKRTDRPIRAMAVCLDEHIGASSWNGTGGRQGAEFVRFRQGPAAGFGADPAQARGRYPPEPIVLYSRPRAGSPPAPLAELPRTGSQGRSLWNPFIRLISSIC